MWNWWHLRTQADKKYRSVSCMALAKPEEASDSGCGLKMRLPVSATSHENARTDSRKKKWPGRQKAQTIVKKSVTSRGKQVGFRQCSRRCLTFSEERCSKRKYNCLKGAWKGEIRKGCRIRERKQGKKRNRLRKNQRRDGRRGNNNDNDANNDQNLWCALR